MSGSPYPTYPPQHPHHGRPYIAVHDHDILCGRGVNIASHPGNERFRALVQTRHDNNYCTLYTTSEKRAVAEEILRHIKALDPPGRFLKRVGKAPTSRGLHGPWEELSDREAIKKTCQALRDCNRTDRTGYAAAVSMPDDVRQHAQSREASGLSNKEQAARAAAAKMRSDGASSTTTAGVTVPTPSSHVPHSSNSAIAPGPMPLHPYPPRDATGAPIPVPMSISMGMHLPIRPAPGATSSHGYPLAPPPPGMPLPPPPPQPSVHHLHHLQLPHAPPSAAAHALHSPHPLHYHQHPGAAYHLHPGVHLQHAAAAAAAAAYHSHQQQQQHQAQQQHQQKSRTPPGRRKAPPHSQVLVEIAPAQPPVPAHRSDENRQSPAQHHQQHVQHHPPPPPLSQPQRVPTDGSLKRDRSSYEDDRTVSPSVQKGAEWLKKQKTAPATTAAAAPSPEPTITAPSLAPAPVPTTRRVSAPQPIDTRFLLPTPTGNTITPSSTAGSIPGFLSLASYDMGPPARTPSQETPTTRGTTPTSDGTNGTRAHRPSMSPASGMSAMPPSPTLAYDPHRAGAVDPTLYSHDDYGTPPTPTASDHNPFAYHHLYQEHTEAPGAEPKHPYSTEATFLEQQQLQEAAAYVNATSDGHLGADYANDSPNSYHDDSLHNF